MTPGWWVGVCARVSGPGFAGCLWSWDAGSPRRRTRTILLWDLLAPLPRPLLRFVISPSWRTPGQKFAAVQHLGRSAPVSPSMAS